MFPLAGLIQSVFIDFYLNRLYILEINWSNFFRCQNRRYGCTTRGSGFDSSIEDFEWDIVAAHEVNGKNPARHIAAPSRLALERKMGTFHPVSCQNGGEYAG